MKDFPFALAFLTVSSLLSAKVKLAEYLPDSAWVTMEVDDLSNLQKDLKEGPFGNIWKHPGIKQLRERLPKAFPENPENGPSKELFERIIDFGEQFSGQVAFAFGGIENMLKVDDDDEYGLPEVVLLAETEMTPEDLNELIRWLEKEVKDSGGHMLVEKEEIGNETVFFLWDSRKAEDEEKRMGIFVVDGIFGFGGGRSAIENLVESLADEPSGGIVENPDYREVFEEIGEGDVRFFLNLRGLGDLLDVVGESEDMQIPENPFGVTTKGIIDALGLEGAECIGLKMDFDEGGMEIASAFFMGEREGLLKLMRLPDGDAPLVSFVPSGVATATVARYDLGAVWPIVEEILRKVSPALYLLLDSQIQAFETKAGVNVRKDILGALGDELVTFSDLKPLDREELDEPSDLPMSEFFAVSLRDSEVFDRSLRTMLGSIAPGGELFQDREHKGITVRSMRGAEGTGIDLSYAVTPKWLLVNLGDRARMLRVISRLNKSRKSLWKEPSVAAVLRETPKGVKQWDYVDLENLSNFLFPLLGMALEDSKFKLELGITNKDESFFDKDFPSLPYFLLTWTRESKRGFISKAKLFPKGD
ncbi:MAG: hypothetical protein O3A82_14240 [Verrucomicrobia bacterium]|jgi:hypothetical protein|nr:hypothetical protein [Verrucomicrobiota bacterium]MDA0723916.1 hypothetical protein [Verrucomicrobiota bacterium]MDA1048075.1 hypothetical protein [Verrucomicrobiota bacterium]